MERLSCFQHWFIPKLLLRRVTFSTYFDGGTNRIYGWSTCGGGWGKRSQTWSWHTVLLTMGSETKGPELETSTKSRPWGNLCTRSLLLAPMAMANHWRGKCRAAQTWRQARVQWDQYKFLHTTLVWVKPNGAWARQAQLELIGGGCLSEMLACWHEPLVAWM